MTAESAILASGCFWGAQDLIRALPGVISTRTGYSGDDGTPNPTYRNHGDHAEAVEVRFIPTVISYRELLAFFFQIHDPTTLNRQGNDIGRGYRSAVFATNEGQRETALDVIFQLNESGVLPGKVVTEVTDAGEFWEAEQEHQDYLLKHPGGYSCHFVRPEWQLAQTT